MFLLCAILLFSCSESKRTANVKGNDAIALKLWYEQPATSWMREALPIGNGYMGAMVFGGIEQERIQFNEESLWVGGPGEWDEYNGGNRTDAYKHLPKIRQLLNEGEFKEAHQLASTELTGIIKKNNSHQFWEGFGAYQAFGDLYIDVDNSGKISNYRRELDIDNAIASVAYTADEVSHKRTYFANHPDNVLVFKFENDAKEGVDYGIEFTTPHKNVNYTFEDNQLIVEGALENNGMRFGSRMHVEIEGGQIVFEEEKIKIKGTKSLTLRLVAGTEYKSDYPTYVGNDFMSKNITKINSAKAKSFKTLKEEHKEDYQSLFNRVVLELETSAISEWPTDKRLKVYETGKEDPSLEALYFQYGRYLLISSSRPGSMPANLQGKWNDKVAPPWASDYHMNINIEMIYWPAEVANLSECHEPLIDYVETLIEPGKVSASNFFNADGWIVNTMNNPFGYTAPGWGFPWGFFPGGAGWLSQHAWEHYDFTRDKAYLEQQGFPIMKEAALFWLDYLVQDKEGYLVSSPSYSPEHGGISAGASMDLQIAWDLFTNCISACEALGIDDEFRQKVVAAKSKILSPKIGKWGQLQEWKEDVDDPESKHRHVSHLFALHPGKQISIEKTPELAEAAKVSLNARGDEGTGWSLGWKINFWARLQDGNRAHKIIRRLLKTTTDEGFEMVIGGGTYSNLLCAHPPFQLDGNMGGTAGIAEMLIQSHDDNIRLLPALPGAWNKGVVKGLKARGGFEVDIEWENGRLKQTKITSKTSKVLNLQYGDHKVSYKIGESGSIILNNDLKKIE
ncbi:glycoside hydrolase family 95 protein [Tamlana sp. 2201CG12-4]|uniref:glycoside hydrolase family 95 protein n=1 Tax=Tamlana sp. 2201CG12-4 TaxID=3112582 RepID=UPI002DB9A0E5|nr:glycoside hydrolase family 95 protein [Tamlana sp. 2201CG12-4]MEC3908476.1 glycoside hydrolase family 95 protein [Tamlana sp. 2201CG12-4]